MDETDTILSDIEKLNDHNQEQEDDIIEEASALNALTTAGQSEGLSSNYYSFQNYLETDQQPAFESQQTIFVKPQNVYTEGGTYSFEDANFENDCEF